MRSRPRFRIRSAVWSRISRKRFSAGAFTTALPRSWRLTTHGPEQRLRRSRPAAYVTRIPAAMDRSVVLRVRRPDDAHRGDVPGLADDRQDGLSRWGGEGRGGA